MLKNLDLKKTVLSATLLAFLVNAWVLPAYTNELSLPAPGTRVGLSVAFNPPVLKGLKVDPANPLRFDFILHTGNEVPDTPAGGRDANRSLKKAQLLAESTKLIKYFLASLTIPEKDLWVNLSPYEKDRIVPEAFGQTEMGRDLLAQDYLLKQITASLIYPEDEIGKKFWKRVYEEASKKFGTTNIPVNTFNKVWIVPEKAVVYENVQVGTAYVVESKLKVMLEQDYLALEKNELSPTLSLTKRGGQSDSPSLFSKRGLGGVADDIVREIIIPQLTKEINQGKNFAQLRQVYNSLILATWYKKKIKDSLLSREYADKDKVDGMQTRNPMATRNIYDQYLLAFKKGVFNMIREDVDGLTRKLVPRKYFSGGVDGRTMGVTLTYASDIGPSSGGHNLRVSGDFAMASSIAGERGSGAKRGMGVDLAYDSRHVGEEQANAEETNWEKHEKPVWQEALEAVAKAGGNKEKVVKALGSLRFMRENVFKPQAVQRLVNGDIESVNNRIRFLMDLLESRDDQGKRRFRLKYAVDIISRRKWDQGLIERVSFLKEKRKGEKFMFADYQIAYLSRYPKNWKEGREMITGLLGEGAGRYNFSAIDIIFIIGDGEELRVRKAFLEWLMSLRWTQDKQPVFDYTEIRRIFPYLAHYLRARKALVSYLISLRNQGEVLLNGPRIAGILERATSVEESRPLIEDLHGLETEAGDPLLDGAALQYVLNRKDDFDFDRFKEIWRIFSKTGHTVREALQWTVQPKQRMELLGAWAKTDLTSITLKEEKASFLKSMAPVFDLFSYSEFDFVHLQQLLKALVPKANKEFSKSISAKQARLSKIWWVMENRQELSDQDNDRIKELMLSPNVSVRKMILGKVLGHLSQSLKEKKNYGLTAQDTEILDYIFYRYDWMQPQAGLNQLLKNVQHRVLRKSLRAYQLKWISLSSEDKRRRSQIQALREKGMSEAHIQQYMSHRYPGFSLRAETISWLKPTHQGIGDWFSYNSWEKEMSASAGDANRPISLVNINIFGRERAIEAGTVMEALRLFWEQHGDPTKDQERIAGLVNRGRVIIEINGVEIPDLTTAWQTKPLAEGNNSIVIREAGGSPDSAQITPAVPNELGGIDFKSDRMNVEVKGESQAINFKVDQAMLQSLRHAHGLVPVISHIGLITDLRVFLGAPPLPKDQLASVGP